MTCVSSESVVKPAVVRKDDARGSGEAVTFEHLVHSIHFCRYPDVFKNPRLLRMGRRAGDTSRVSHQRQDVRYGA